MKYFLLLAANCFFVLFSSLFLLDFRWWPKATLGRIGCAVWLSAVLYVAYNAVNVYLLKRMGPESGVIYKLAAGVKDLALDSHAFIQPFQKEFYTSLLIAGGIILVSLVLMGLPGGVLVGLLGGIKGLQPIKGDNVWPASLLVSIFLPLCIPIAVLVKNALIQYDFGQYSTLGLFASGILWALFVLIGTMLLFQEPPTSSSKPVKQEGGNGVQVEETKVWQTFISAVNKGNKDKFREISASTIKCFDCLENTESEGVALTQMKMDDENWYERIYSEQIFVPIDKFMVQDYDLIFTPAFVKILENKPPSYFLTNNNENLEVVVTTVEPSAEFEGMQHVFHFRKEEGAWKFAELSTIP